MKIRAFITHKKSEKYEDCQDRFSINTENKSIAVSDGMSQSIMQTLWADMLTKSYTNDLNWKPTLENVKILGEKWRETVDLIKIEREKKGEQTYRLDNSLNQNKHAGATFLGVRFKAKNEFCYDVLGDCCLILINKELIIRDIISSQDTDNFDNFPDFFDSCPLKDGKGKLKSENATIEEGVTWLLVSDPFSDFLSSLKDKELSKDRVKEILAVENHNSFTELVEKWRELGMHNDDSTLIIIEYDNNDFITVNYQDNIDELIKNEQVIIQVPVGLPEEIKFKKITQSNPEIINKEQDLISNLETSINELSEFYENNKMKCCKEIKRIIHESFGILKKINKYRVRKN
jgi:hypothetical protein